MGVLGGILPKPIDFHEGAKDGVPSAEKIKESVWSYNTFQLKLQAIMMAPMLLAILKSHFMGETTELDGPGGMEPESAIEGIEPPHERHKPPHAGGAGPQIREKKPHADGEKEDWQCEVPVGGVVRVHGVRGC